MIKETREERIARRKRLGFNNPKKDKWAKRRKPIRLSKVFPKRPKELKKSEKPIREILEKELEIPKPKWYQRLLKQFSQFFQRSIKLLKRWLLKK